MIKAVLTDIDNTLLDFDKCAEKAIADSCAEFKIEYGRYIFDAFSVINDRLWKRLERKELTKAELHRIRWETIFARCNVNGDGQAFEISFRNKISENAEKVDGAEELLKYLSEKYIVCVASNASHSEQKKRLEKAGLSKYIDKFFISADIGFDKPDEKFFAACLAELNGIRKDEVIMIGDSLSADVKGGADFGFKTCWFNKFSVPTPGNVKPDYIVYSLKEIENIL